MLSALRIEHFAIIDALEVEFGPGLTVLTGETGAGKSILVDALHLALGGRAAPEVVRTGEGEATVEAVFQVGPEIQEQLRLLGLPEGSPEPGAELLIRRLVPRAGRGRVWVNGALCTVAILERLARRLCDISSQHEHLSLLDPTCHLPLLDGYAGLVPRRDDFGEAYLRLEGLRAEEAELRGDDAERARRADYLAFQLREIDEVDPKPDEERALAAERALLAATAKMQALAQSAEEALYSGEGAATERLGIAVARVGELAAIDPTQEPLHATLASARADIEEAARDLSRLARRLRENPERLLALDDRISALRRLARKHGGEADAVLARRTEMQEELRSIEGRAGRLDELALALEGALSTAVGLADDLSLRRRQAAAKLAAALQKELARLGMQKSRFEVRLAPATLGPRGADGVEFFFSANPGEEPRPLARIASGGELSRLMLAVKRAGAGTDPVDVYVFDEVDSGIGGPTAQVVGRMLKEVSRERQVLCITHLPQIAAFADHHVAVRKSVERGRTSSSVALLTDQGDRCHELARMLGGEEPTPIALRHAQELLERSAGLA